jgi:hypothetical protein
MCPANAYIDDSGTRGLSARCIQYIVSTHLYISDILDSMPRLEEAVRQRQSLPGEGELNSGYSSWTEGMLHARSNQKYRQRRQR